MLAFKKISRRMYLVWLNAQLEYTGHTVFPRFSTPGRLPIFEVFGGALIKTYENLDLPFPAHTRALFIIYDN